MAKVMVSVVMITYAHEKYIKQAIDGVLMQVCDFDVELIISNDCSPDETDIIVNEIVSKHPKSIWIKYIKHTKNIGMMPNFIWALQQSTGKYIALCEGDDFWTDPYKLQKQVDFLEANEDFVINFHPVKLLHLDGVIKEDHLTNVPTNFETIEMLAFHGNYIHTPSVVFRNIIKQFPESIKESPIGDYFLYMLLAQNGKIGMNNESMSIYRYETGIHSSKSAEHKTNNFILTLNLIQKEMINEDIKEILKLQEAKLQMSTLPSAIRNNVSFFTINQPSELIKYVSMKNLLVAIFKKAVNIF